MRVVTNTELAKRNRRLANYLFFATFAVLVGGFIFINFVVFTDSLAPQLTIILQLLLIPLALILTIVSVRMTNLWARRPYPDEAIQEGLKGISQKSVLYSYYHFPARHVLICPQGVFAIVTRWHGDRFVISDGQWRAKKGFISRMANGIRMDGIGNPEEDVAKATAAVQAQIAEVNDEVTVNPLLVFLDPKAEIEGDEPSIPVVFADPKHADSLKKYLREYGRDETEKGSKSGKSTLPLTEQEIEAFEEATLN